MFIKKIALPLLQLIQLLKIMKKRERKKHKKVNVTLPQIIEYFQCLDGKKPTYVTLVTNVDARLLKTNNPYLNVRKISKFNALINTNYGNRVNTGLENEGKIADFKPKKLAYGSRNDKYNGCVLNFENNPKLSLSIQKVLVKPKYIHENKLIDKSKIKDFIPEKKPNKNQGLDKKIIWLNYDMKNIRKVYHKNIMFKIVG